MPRVFLCILFGCLLPGAFSAQADSVQFSPDTRLEDGVYVTYSDFRRNNGVSRVQVLSQLDKEQLEFFSKALLEDTFSFKIKEEVLRVLSKTVWGYRQNNTLYINYQGDFYRVPVFGSISYLVAQVTVYNPGFYDPRFGMSTGGGTTREIREFLFNFYDGELVPFTLNTAEDLLRRDKTLYDAYKKLNRRKQKEQVYGFIRKYNAQHPVYFLN
jgi:hypothetical protein